MRKLFVFDRNLVSYNYVQKTLKKQLQKYLIPD